MATRRRGLLAQAEVPRPEQLPFDTNANGDDEMRVIEAAYRAPTPTRAVAQMTPRESQCCTGHAQLKARFERDATPLLAELHRHTVRITGNRADAEDLLQS